MPGARQKCKHVATHAAKHCLSILDDAGRRANWCAYGVTFHRHSTTRDQLADFVRQGGATVQILQRTSVQVRDDLQLRKGGLVPPIQQTFMFWTKQCGTSGFASANPLVLGLLPCPCCPGQRGHGSAGLLLGGSGRLGFCQGPTIGRQLWSSSMPLGLQCRLYTSDATLARVSQRIVYKVTPPFGDEVFFSTAVVKDCGSSLETSYNECCPRFVFGKKQLRIQAHLYYNHFIFSLCVVSCCLQQ